ncbi:response regulator transcription factor [Chlorobium sp. BLA1]|uniref:response regulator transcription factor n=1 Tax=Candidatus Chlorobium masyuteum TaxID=2716876 RepID=UPI001420140B|nr:response regulator transcription factor [Candidatus Chlorobium masyuteum]NHQ60706.1 response regulator transcription factor [Candidatus Chlorobium masyuteum]NTU45341.1 response regulator transcription factor [Chlorobiaceae bacterium]
METTSSASTVNGKRIIIVEDDNDFRESIIEYLQLTGFEVTASASALEFYQILSQQFFQLVIIDIGLPDQSGLVLAEYIRNNTDMRIIMLTADSSQSSKINAYKSGADIYLVKPVDFSELTATINSILGRVDAQHSNNHEIKKSEPVRESAQKYWKLIRKSSTLCSPSGDEIKLTSKEFEFMQVLAVSNNSIILRQDLLKALDYKNNDSGNRALVALVNRLRRKNDKLDYKSPVKTVHGSGYCFSAPIIVE